MKTLAIVFTPFQYLNVLRYYETIQGKLDILVLTSSKQNIEQIKKLDLKNRCRFPFNRLTFLNNEVLWALKCIYAVFFIKKKLYSRIVVGNYKNVLAFYLTQKFDKEGKEVVLVDDGLATINIYKKRINRVREVLFGGHLIKLYKRLLFFNKRDINKLHFFTAFNLEILGHNDRDKIIKQNIIINKGYKQNNEVWFIGSPVVEQSILKEEYYRHILNQIHTEAIKKGQVLIYIMHRAERRKVFNFKTMSFDLPLEVVFRNLSSTPTCLYSLYSTALLNIATSYPDIDSYYINISNLSLKPDQLTSVYKYFSLHNTLKEYIIDPWV